MNPNIKDYMSIINEGFSLRGSIEQQYNEDSSKITSLEMAQDILVPEFGFKEFTKNRMYIKYISSSFYITAQCYDGAFVLALFNRKTMKTDDELIIHGKANEIGKIISDKDQNKILNKLTQWVKQFSSKDPALDDRLGESLDSPNSLKESISAEAIKELENKITGVIGISRSLGDGLIINIESSTPVSKLPSILATIEHELFIMNLGNNFSRKVVGGLYSGSNFQVEIIVKN